ncbi:MAG: hypothetical protein IJ523_03515 [Succinivibrionaceae bacterium]|nr:hypothetical protein [Succinivibrionaceae bacterium]
MFDGRRGHVSARTYAQKFSAGLKEICNAHSAGSGGAARPCVFLVGLLKHSVFSSNGSW